MCDIIDLELRSTNSDGRFIVRTPEDEIWAQFSDELVGSKLHSDFNGSEPNLLFELCRC